MRRLIRRLVGLSLALIMIPAFAKLPADLPQPVDAVVDRPVLLVAYRPGADRALRGGP